MRGHFRYLRFKTFSMTPRTPQWEVFWALLSNPKHSGVPEDSKSPTLGVLGFTPTLGQSGVAKSMVSCRFKKLVFEITSQFLQNIWEDLTFLLLYMLVMLLNWTLLLGVPLWLTSQVQSYKSLLPKASLLHIHYVLLPKMWMCPLCGDNWVYKYRMKYNNWFVKLVKTLRFHVVLGSRFRFVPIDLTFIITLWLFRTPFLVMMNWASMQLMTFQCKHVQCYTLFLWLSWIELSKL
jgi:hypothetical protein